MYYGKGFTHSDVYDMPIYLRKFYFKKILDAKKVEKEQVEKATKKSKPISKPNLSSKFRR